MASRPKYRAYSDSDRARVQVILQTNDGNVKRTSRDTGVPIGTIRAWRDTWETKGVPEAVQELASEEAQDFVNQAQSVRFEAIVLLRSKLHEASPRDLVTIVGILDDKVTRAKGLATGRVEHVHTPQLPPPEELGALIGGFIAAASDAARKRQSETIEVERKPAQKALPPAP